MSRGHGELQRFVLTMLERGAVLSISDLAIMRWPEDRHLHGNRPPYKPRVESMRRACNRLIEQGLIKTSSSRNWERYCRSLSPVGYVPTFGTEQKVVFSKDYVIGG